jgi:hypothetical protein
MTSAQLQVAEELLARADEALSEYERFVRSRIVEAVPAPSGDIETDYRRCLGMAIAKLEAARLILGELRRGETAELPGAGIALEVARLAYQTVHDLARVADSPQLRRVRQIAMEMTELWVSPVGSGDDQLLRQIAQERLGILAS